VLGIQQSTLLFVVACAFNICTHSCRQRTAGYLRPGLLERANAKLAGQAREMAGALAGGRMRELVKQRDASHGLLKRDGGLLPR